MSDWFYFREKIFIARLKTSFWKVLWWWWVRIASGVEINYLNERKMCKLSIKARNLTNLGNIKSEFWIFQIYFSSRLNHNARTLPTLTNSYNYLQIWIILALSLQIYSCSMCRFFLISFGSVSRKIVKAEKFHFPLHSKTDIKEVWTLQLINKQPPFVQKTIFKF